MSKVRWVLSYDFYSQFHTLSSSAKSLKIIKIWQSYRQFNVGRFFETQCNLLLGRERQGVGDEPITFCLCVSLYLQHLWSLPIVSVLSTSLCHYVVPKLYLLDLLLLYHIYPIPTIHSYSTLPTVYQWKDQNLHNRLHIGHTCLTHSYLIEHTVYTCLSHSCLIEHTDPPKCTNCNQLLSVKHILTECTSCGQARHQYCSLTGIFKNQSYTQPKYTKFYFKSLLMWSVTISKKKKSYTNYTFSIKQLNFNLHI